MLTLTLALALARACVKKVRMKVESVSWYSHSVFRPLKELYQLLIGRRHREEGPRVLAAEPRSKVDSDAEAHRDEDGHRRDREHRAGPLAPQPRAVRLVLG